MIPHTATHLTTHTKYSRQSSLSRSLPCLPANTSDGRWMSRDEDHQGPVRTNNNQPAIICLKNNRAAPATSNTPGHISSSPSEYQLQSFNIASHYHAY